MLFYRDKFLQIPTPSGIYSFENKLRGSCLFEWSKLFFLESRGEASNNSIYLFSAIADCVELRLDNPSNLKKQNLIFNH